MHTRNKKQRGFTLIELMIVVAVIGILVSIAYPSYQSSVTKARRSDGMSTLLNIMNAQERNFTMNNVYTTDMSSLGFTVNAGEVVSENSFYRISASFCTSGDSSCVILTAAPQGGQANDGNLTYNSVGTKTPIDKW